MIDPFYLSHDEDKQVMIAGGKKALQVLEAQAFDDLRIHTHIPSRRSSDGEWLQHIRESAECVYHPVGTCKMGTDEMSVVDPTLCVRGVGHLSVVDASIMPVITSGNTNAPVIMIAEKAADLIKSRSI